MLLGAWFVGAGATYEVERCLMCIGYVFAGATDESEGR